MTNSLPPPDPSESTRPKKPILSFDEMVAIVVAFTTIAAILFWSWGVRKSKLLTQNWQKLRTATEETSVLRTEPQTRFDSRRSIDREAEETEVLIFPETRSQLEATDDLDLERTDTLASRKRRTSLRDYPQPIVVLPTEPIAPTPPETVETPTEPIAPTPPETVETPTEPIAPTPPETAETPTEPIVTFDDVPLEHWAYPFIEPLIEKELIVGISDNEFEPDLPITRAQLAAEIETAFKQETSRDFINFEDVSRESKTAEKINEAVKTGFLKGYPGQVFRPDEQVPRLQVLVALVSGLDLKLEPGKDPETILSSYQDADQIPDWAREKMAIAIESGLVVNRPSFNSQLLYPNESATRAEVVATIYQGLVKAGREEPISSPYVVSSP